MASVSVALILFFTVFEITRAAQRQNHQLKSIINPGSSLSPSGQPSWNSSSGQFQFGFYRKGSGYSLGIWLVTAPNITVVWTANRDEHPVPSNATLTLTMDGKLMLKTEESNKKPIAVDEPASFASMLDSGNFVLYNNRYGIIWESFSTPTDTILGGQSLEKGEQLLSSVTETNASTGRFCLSMQEDGNLVLYPRNMLNKALEAYWSSDTEMQSDSMKLNLNGVLQLMIGNKTQKILFRSSYSRKSMNGTVIYRTTLDSDGILRLYSHHFKNDGTSTVNIEWSALEKQCVVKGFCGLNSYCSAATNSSTKGDCHCFRGFTFINPDMKFLGCYRNFSDEEGCKRKLPAEFYNITSLRITWLGGLPYAKLSVGTKDCSKSCLNDCYCGAAFYSDGACSKHKFPLMFAKKDQDASAILFIKWSSGQANLITRRIDPPFGVEKVDDKKTLLIVLAACLGSITFLCFLIAVSSLLVYKHRVYRYQKLQGNSNLGTTQEFILHSFSYSELETATNGFQEELGRGHFGAVYKGAICEGKKIVAVKRLENPVEEGERKFQAEMAAVRQTHHKNLVRLLGFCIQSSKKLLVYEFMSKGLQISYSISKHARFGETE